MDKTKFLKQLANELHKPAIRKFPRRKVFVPDLNDTWACDLVDMQGVSEENRGYKYLLTIIDCFSRYAWAVPLKTKQGKEVSSAFEKLFEKSIPKKLYVDQGGEFLNKEMDNLRKKHDIQIYHTYSDYKVSLIERFNRTLKTIMWKKFTENQSYDWWNMLPDLLKEYNNRVHSSIKMTPIDATKEKGIQILKAQLQEESEMFQYVPTKIKIGDHVRISRYKGKFEKSYTPNWSLEIFKVISRSFTDPPTFKIADWKGNKIEGSFYTQELSLTKLADIYLVDEVIRRKTEKGVKKAFVSWLGYGSDANSWVDEKEIIDLH